MARIILLAVVLLAWLAPFAGALVPPQTVTADPCGVTVADGGVALTRPEAGISLFRDDMDDPTAWTLTGPTSVFLPLAGAPGCHLRMMPACCQAYRDATRFVGLDPAGPYLVSFSFRVDAIADAADFDFEVLAEDRSLVFTTTEGVGANNGFRLSAGDLVSTTFGDSGLFGSWSEARAWYRVQIEVDPARGLARAAVLDETGERIATSAIIPTGGEGSLAHVDAVRFRGFVHAAGQGLARQDYDTLVIARGGGLDLLDEVVLFHEPFASLAGWTVKGSGSTHACDAGSCHLQLQPPCCSIYHDVSRALAIDPEGVYAVSVRFQGDAAAAGPDTLFEGFDPLGNSFFISATEPGFGGNNGWRISYGDAVSTTFADTGPFAGWQPQAWYEARAFFDPAAGLGWLEVSRDGSVVAQSAAVDFGEGRFAGLRDVRFRSISYGEPGTFHWDDLRVVD